MTAGEQHSEGELPEPKHDHRSGEITTVEAVVGSLRIIQEDEWRCKVSSCTGDFHRLKDCLRFGHMDPKNRMVLVERLKLCMACLTPGHNQLARKCPYKEERADACREPACKAGHHPLLHIKGGRKRQGQEGLRAVLEGGTREEAHPETTDTLHTGHQAEEEGWSCKMRTCRAELHTLRECGEFRELPPAARFNLVRQHDLCQVCRGPRWCQVKGENCRWRNRIRMELCGESRCRRKHHQLLPVEKGLEKEEQGERSPAESSVAASVSGLAQGGELWSPGQLVAEWIRTPKGGPRLAFWDTGSQVTLITNRAVQAMGLQAIHSPFLKLQCVGDGRSTTAKAQYKVPLLDIGGRVVTLLAFGIENIMPPLKEGDLASMKAAFPEVPTGGLVTAAGEVSLLVGQDNLSLFPVEKRRVGGAALYGSRFGTGYIASGRPPRAKGDGGDRRAEACTAVREEHEPKEAADCPEPPGEPPESLICDEVQTATTGITVAQAIGGQGDGKRSTTTRQRPRKTAGWIGRSGNSSRIQTGRTLRTIGICSAPTAAGGMAMVPTAAGEPRHR